MKIKTLTLIVSVLSVFLWTACSKNASPVNNYPKAAQIEYRLSAASGTVPKVTSITYVNESGGNTTLSDVPLPFTKKFNRTVSFGDDLSLSVLHNNSAGGAAFSLKLDIWVDGKVIKTETHAGTTSVIAAIVHIFN